MYSEKETSGQNKTSAGTQSTYIQKASMDAIPEDNQIMVLIIPEENYIERLINVVKDLTKMDGKVCYVSLNRPYTSLMATFHKAGLNTENIHFIDAITKTAQIPAECQECEFVSSPGALTELSVTVSRAMEGGKFRYIVFDSLSTLLVYESDATIAKFVHFLMAKVRVSGCSAIFTCLKQDSESVLIKDLNMFADRVIQLEKWRIGT
jgi:hypothetical protein